jgi:hypothetical protein
MNYQRFWDWFQVHELKLVRSESPALWQDLSSELSTVDPRLAWETGETEGEQLAYFAASPDFDMDVLPTVKAMIGCAYKSKVWNFRVGKQRRPWAGVVQLGSDDLTAALDLEEFDLSAWRQIVYRVPDTSLFDIVLECGQRFPADGEKLNVLGTIASTTLIGELAIMEMVDQIEIVRQFDDRQGRAARPLAWLPYAFGMKPL